MSLFPAFGSSESKEPENTESHLEPSWLTNTSYKLDIPLPDHEPPTSSTRGPPPTFSIKRKKDKKEHSKKKRKKEKQKKKRKRSSSSSSSSIVSEKNQKQLQEPEDIFEIVKYGHKEYLTVNTIHRPAAPKYHYSNMVLGPISYRFNKKRKFLRYFKIKLDLEDAEAKTANDECSTTKAEEGLTGKTAEFNRYLAGNPEDVNKWLEYVNFQDTVFEFEKMYKKGSQAKGARVTGDRKLAILEKAISHNPDSEDLFRKRLLVAESIFPADELNAYLKVLVEKEPSNIIYWQGYIESVQCSMSHCNTETVLKLYNKCLSTLHQLRRNSALEKVVLEENILRILYQCGLFLKQAGLWEQLWTLLRLYLELNLSASDKKCFNIGNACDEKQLQEYEDIVLKSELPIHELWLRIEKLRESCHWLPWTSQENCEDPQRLVFTDDVSDFIHPITCPGNSVKLIVTIMTLLKVPLLPCRHSTMEEFGLDYVSWAIDGIETLLGAFFPMFPIKISTRYFLTDISKLTIGPQYIKTHPGQEEFLYFVTRTLRNCANCLTGAEQTAILVWWFRFERLLLVLNKENRFKMPTAHKKQLKSEIKSLLKCDEHRNNVLLYAEYALIECEQDSIESAIKIILTALSFNKHVFVPQIADATHRANTCYLYRLLVELKLKNNTNKSKHEAIKYLTYLALGKEIQQDTNLSPSEAVTKFKFTTNNLLTQTFLFAASTPEQYFLPDFATDWIICNAWLLYLVNGAIEAGVFMENILTNENVTSSSWRNEILMEFYVAMLFKNCQDNLGSGMHKLLDEVLHRGLQQFPSNTLLLSIATDLQGIGWCDIKSWWRLSDVLLKSGHALPVLFVILMAVQRMGQIDEIYKPEENCATVVDVNIKNRVRSLFQRITRTDICTKRCGLIWRLYLQFLYTHCKLVDCRKAYYAAVDECPWLKPLYIDAAVYVPAELASIQDLIIEKQLRLHITPEELEVLRS